MDLIELPEKPGNKAPCWLEDNSFDFVYKNKNSLDEIDIMMALVAMSIGEKDCPTPSEWATFSIEGTIIAYLSGKYVIPPIYNEELESCLWEISYPLIFQNKEFSDEFKAALFRLFLPRGYRHSESWFTSWWNKIEFPDSRNSICNLRVKCFKQGVEIMEKLPSDVSSCIKNVAEYAPEMLELVIEYIRSTYHW